MSIVLTNGFVIFLFGVYTFICAFAGCVLANRISKKSEAKDVANQIMTKMYVTTEEMITKEERAIKRTNI
ncbi:hypothetical protein ACK8P5_26340 (plasmid) [Paenibacillus sp. EC2-1]|uniref:hypothetical protein n=1 Tax=Paenibacillus sp. EC2-1 TaxID=3388665 RepID=UPI003BEF0AB8